MPSTYGRISARSDPPNKMKRLYITFSGPAWEETTKKIVSLAPGFGADRVIVYDDLWLTQQPFYSLPRNRWIWDHPGFEGTKRGFGWFCWKPYIIQHALKNFCNPGDIVLFTDADTYPIADFSVLYEECVRQKGIMLFEATGCSNRQYVKRDLWKILGMDRPELIDSQAGVARFMLFQKGPYVVEQFLEEWKTYCLNPVATTFDSSILGSEYYGFAQHRTEQAIMTLLAMMYGIRLFREADEFGNSIEKDKDLFGQLFVQEYGRGQRFGVGSSFANVGSLV